MFHTTNQPLLYIPVKCLVGKDFVLVKSRVSACVIFKKRIKSCDNPTKKSIEISLDPINISLISVNHIKIAMKLTLDQFLLVQHAISAGNVEPHTVQPPS